MNTLMIFVSFLLVYEYTINNLLFLAMALFGQTNLTCPCVLQ